MLARAQLLLVTLPLARGLAANAVLQGRLQRSNATWVDALSEGMLGGLGFPDAPSFGRLPEDMEDELPSSVWDSSRTSAGLFLQFTTEAKTFDMEIEYTTDTKPALPSSFCTSIGMFGADLYGYDEAQQRWGFVTLAMDWNGPQYPTWTLTPFVNTPDLISRLYRLHLPPLGRLRGVRLSAADARADDSFRSKKPILWHGSNSTQGMGSSRPGLMYTNIVMRGLNREVVNLGFSGVGRLEPALARRMATVDAAAVVLEVPWSSDGEELYDGVLEFVRTFRAFRPDVPIVLSEGTSWPSHDAAAEGAAARREALKDAFVDMADSKLQLLLQPVGETGPELESAYTAGLPNDLGHRRVADKFLLVLAGLLDGKSLLETASARRWPSSLVSAGSRVEAPSTTASAVTWVNVRDLGVQGRAFEDTPTIFNRMPKSANGEITPLTWNMSLNSLGLFVQFQSDSPSISLKYKLAKPIDESGYLCAGSLNGFDLYERTSSEDSPRHRFLGSGFEHMTVGDRENEGTLIEDLVPSTGLRSFLLYLPMSNEVVTAHIGVSNGSVVKKETRGFDRAKVVWYGHSILSGGATSRVGNLFANRVARDLDIMIHNLGFSGACFMTLEVAHHLVKVSDVDLFIIDCLSNMNEMEVGRAAPKLLQYIRDNGHERTPILLVEDVPQGSEWNSGENARMFEAKRAAQRRVYEDRKAAGDEHLHYVRSEELFPEKYQRHESVLVEGIHPTDIGMDVMTEFYKNRLPEILF